MKNGILYLGVLVFLMPYAGWSQHDSTRSEVQEDIEQTLQDMDVEESGKNREQLVQLLQGLAAHPVNINQADQQQLREVPGINLKIAKAIIRYREEVKPFELLKELKEVKGIGRVTFEKIRPYTTIGDGLELRKLLYTDHRYWTHDGRFQFFTRYRQSLQQGRGYRETPKEGGYLGSPVQYYQRAGSQSDHLSSNVTQQKDFVF